MSKRRTLQHYLARRERDATPEPVPGERSTSGHPVFVIQEHDATTHHFDLRLEIEGVLVSWAVPKGPSTDPRDKRLAIRTEDHPLEYANFEGVIPEDAYGGGTVIVWDAGAYRNLLADKDDPSDMATSLKNGHIEVWLEGQKVRGGYAIVHVKPGGADDHWLLIKMDDEAADARRNPTSTQRRSVLSGRTIKQVASGPPQ
jgi:DNA ligase D-like protein (predicted 3'-phosphoesterase)